MLQKAPHAKEDNEKTEADSKAKPSQQKVLDAMCDPARTVSERMQRLSKPREQHLHPHIGQSEVHQKALAATFLCALAIALYPSTTFAVPHTSSSQSAHCRNRCGHLQDAENMIKTMQCKSCVVCTALLSACRIHGNVEMGEHVGKQILALEPENAAGHLLLSNIYAALGNMHFCENVEQQRKKRGVKKQLSFEKSITPVEKSIIFITLMMVSILACTIGDAGSMSGQMFHELFACIMSSDTVAPP
ncbi:unnamed protein product [Sphagnum troendelagicum]|uniref:Uncharacterized protein n=1 Tax=Sphagnum troendelagicum TaxID=128251 RepID=A0ABP0UTR4_9BRYO